MRLSIFFLKRTAASLVPAFLLAVSTAVPAHAQFSPTWNLAKAVSEDKIDDARKYLNDGAMINQANKDGLPPLTIATDRRNLDMMKFLMQEARINLNEGTVPARETALMRAAGAGFSEGVELLLSRGADVHAQDKTGETALFKAVRGRRLEIIKRLVAAGARTDETDYNGTTVEDYARQQDRSGNLSRVLAAAMAAAGAK